MNIPIVIICYNNYKYVENTINQMIRINSEFEKNILIMDNKSTCQETINFLNTTKCKVKFNDRNNGPQIWQYDNQDLYNSLPDMFIMTDPDLEFNPKLPTNFIEILVELSNKYLPRKIGFALDLSDADKMFGDDIVYVNPDTGICKWEKQFWEEKIEDETYELYKAPIDTTFCLVNKNGTEHKYIRIAGNFTAKHLPWYKENKLFNPYENYILNKDLSNISTTSKVINKYIDNNYVKIYKNDISFLIKNDNTDSNLNFWTDVYHRWEIETFQVFDRFLDKNKVFIDIGAWIGTTCIYASRKSKHIYAIEADNKSIESLAENCRINCRNYTLIHNAIFNVDDKDMKFGRNLYRPDAKLNDSTSQIYLENEVSNDFYSIKTITIKSIIDKYNIDVNNISLIKVDIEGGEEHILNDLYEIYSLHKVPLYVSFHYSWWKNFDLDRFSFLTNEQKDLIRREPFCSILFSQT